MRSLTIQVSDDVIDRLATEAALMHITVEELAAERVSLPRAISALDSSGATEKTPNYLQLAAIASRAPSARKSVVEIDKDIETSRNEW